MSNHFVSTTATESRCRHCRRPTLTALDEGQPAHVDATPLPDRQAEINALLNNRRTYTHTTYGQLHYRDENKLRNPTTPGARIHAEHKCVGTKQLTLDIGG